MNCYYHNHKDAVGTCQDCGKGLCRECMDTFTIPVCESCNSIRWANMRQTAMFELRMMLLFAICGTAFCLYNGGNVASWGVIFLPLAWAGIYAGWKCLDCITSKVFLFLPIGGWVLYFFIKLLASVLISYPAVAYRLFKNIRIIKGKRQTMMV